jgi:hypothetical protein
MAKEGLIARQFMLGVVQTGDGLPIYHEVFDGNTAEAPTLVPTIKKVLQRFESIRRVVFVADRGLLSLDNLDALQEISLASGHQPLEYVLAVPGRRYREFVDLLGPFHDLKCAQAAEEVIDEMPWRNLRLVVAHNPRAAQEANAIRRERMASLEAQAAAWVGKLDAQDLGAKARGRKLSDSGAKARFYHEVREHSLGNIIKVDLKGELFSYAIDEEALALAELMDGKLLLVTNTRDLSAQSVVNRYKSLADIERGFRVLKSRSGRCFIGCRNESRPMPASALSLSSSTGSCDNGSVRPKASSHPSVPWSSCSDCSTTKSASTLPLRHCAASLDCLTPTTAYLRPCI